MDDPFADAVGEVIQGALDFRASLYSGKMPSLDETRTRFIKLVDEFARKGRLQASRTPDFDLARGALVYWIDEMLTLHWPVPFAEEFRAVCLELHYTDLKSLKGRSPLEHDRAVDGPYSFFELSEIAKTRDQPDALETFYLCAALGFRGRHEGKEHVLEEWARLARAHIVARLRKKHVETSLDGAPLSSLRGEHLFMGISVMVAVTAVITLVAFITAIHVSPY
jgi:type VI secretion system protein ImpK